MRTAAARWERDARIIGMSRPTAPDTTAGHSDKPRSSEDPLGGPLMDVRDVVSFLGVPVSQVHNLAESGSLPAVRIERLIRFTRRDVAEFVRAETA